MQRVIVLVITWAFMVAFVVAFGRTADAHVAPSVDDNNRYLKVTPAGDRIRLAYTVFFGENPGRQMRPGLDTDKDGALSDEEGEAFGAKLSREVADGIDITLDGAPRPVAITWSTVAVGLGTPDVSAGSFSVDMVAYVCLPAGPGRHTLLLKDRFRVPRPGETEVKVEDGLGITIEHARVGPFDDSTHDYKLVGPGGPLMDDGLDLAFVISDKAPRGDQACTSPVSGGSGSRSGPSLLVLALVLAGAVGLIAIAAVASRRARRRPPRPR